MKNYEEMSEIVLKRIDEYNKEKEIRSKYLKRIVISATCFIVISLALGLWKSGVIDKAMGDPELAIQTGSIARNENGFEASSQSDENVPGMVRESSDITTTAVIENSQERQENLAGETQDKERQSKKESTSQANLGDHSYQGGNYEWWCIPALPFDRQIEVVGEELTDEEAAKYFKENIGHISGSLSASGIAVDDLKIMPKGYCHVSYNGVEGKSFELKQNFRDYLVYNSDKLIAIITLVKENGKISDTPSFGATWFDNYNAVLQQHKGEKIVFIYSSWMEFAVTPDGRYFSPMGIELGLDFGDNDIYQIFYHEKAVYVP